MVATIAIIVLLFGKMFVSLAKHGQPYTGKYNFWISVLATVLQLWLFNVAGLFDKFNF